MAFEIDISVEGDMWGDASPWEKLAHSAVDTAATHLPLDFNIEGHRPELSILMTHDAVVQHLNAQWRDKDKPTNVLSFPAMPSWRGKGVPPMLGDIVLAFETIDSEAHLQGKALRDHVAHLIVHGFLHLLGYDHETDADAEDMEHMERAILANMNIADPYRD
ncbi:MAG: rRNA maturation RNase YbeY [Pseudomonadota bacterium]